MKFKYYYLFMKLSQGWPPNSKYYFLDELCTSNKTTKVTTIEKMLQESI